MILDSLAPSTVKSYSNVINEFNQFVLSLDSGLDCFTVTPAHVSLFMSYLFQQGHSRATNISSLAFWHKIDGHPDPTDHVLVRRLITAMRKKKTQIDSAPYSVRSSYSG